MATGDDEHLIERRIGGRRLTEGGWLELYRDDVALPDGTQATREYVKHPGAVAVVPILDDGRIVLVRQFRYPVGKITLEMPAGKLDAGEDTLACAKRELQEETGYVAREWGFRLRDPQRRRLFQREHLDLVRARAAARPAEPGHRRVRRGRHAHRRGTGPRGHVRRPARRENAHRAAVVAALACRSLAAVVAMMAA